jgi:hypothetical protein
MDDSSTSDARSVLVRWEQAMTDGTLHPLRDTFYPEGCCVCAASPNGEELVFDNGEHLIVMLETAMVWGAATTSKMTVSRTAATEDVAMFHGTWDLVSMAFGNKPYAFAATAIRTSEGWKIVSLCAAAH